MKITQVQVQSMLKALLDQRGSVSTLDYGIVDSSVGSGDIEQSIYPRLASKKFRKTKMDPDCAARTKNAIHSKVSQQQPLKVIYPQGGYKLWRFPSSPEADWAEFFNLAYLVEYLSPIAASYQPGVELVYYLHTLLMERHDNLTTVEIQAYVDSFQYLIDQFSHYLPKNFKISILRDADLYSREEYFEKLEEGRLTAQQEYEQWPEARKKDFRRMAKLNIKWQGAEDWTLLSPAQKEEKIQLAALYETAAVSNLARVGELVKAPENILVFTISNKMFIGIGSTHTSMAKYWVGFGVLELSAKGILLPRILTPSQYEMAVKLPHQELTVQLFPNRNLQKIWVFEQPFDFCRPQ